MEKKTLRTANWLKSVFLLAVMLIGAFSASANITQEMSLGELRSGSSYNVPANTHATGYFTAPSDGTVILTSNVDANTNLTPYYDSEYTEVVSTERDELAKTKSFEAVSGTTYYFAATTSPTTSFEVLFTFKEKKPIPEYVYPVGITPEDGATVAELSTIKMKMSTQDFNFGKNRYAVVYNSSDVQVSAGTLVYDSDDYYAIVINLSPAVKTDGEYKVVILEEAYRVQGVLNPELTYNYTVDSSMGGGDEPGQSADVTFTPNPAEVLSSLETISVKFNDISGQAYMQPKTQVPVLNANGEEVATATCVGGYNVMSISINPIITTSGEYTIKFNKGDIQYISLNPYGNHEYEYEFEVTYTVEGVVEPEPEPTPTINMSFEPNPEEVQTSLAKVVVKFPDLGSDKFVIANVTTVNVYDANGNIVREGQLNGGSQVEVDLIPEIKESGVYTIKFNDSDLMVYKGDNIPAFEVTYTVEAPELPVATWSIAEGAVVDNFESVTLTFEGVESASTMMYVNAFYSVAEDGTATLVQNYCSEGVMDASAEGASITFSIDRECYMNLYGGNYRIIIPVGSVKFNGDKTNTNTEEYVLNFTLDAPGAPVEVDAAFTANPENNATVSELKEVVLTFTDYESISVAELDLNMGTNIATLHMVDELTGSPMPAGHVFFEPGSAANALRLYFPMEYNGFDAVAIEGSYMIRIPAGVVTFTDGVSKEIVLNYTVKANVEEPTGAPIAVSPEVGTTVETLSEIELTFDANYYTSGAIYPDTQTSPSVYDASGKKLEVAVIMMNDLNKLNLKLNPALTESGTYTIKFPEGAVRDLIMYPIASPAFELTYTVEAPAPVATGAPIAVSPEAGAPVESLSEIVLTFDKNYYVSGEVLGNWTPFPAVYNESGEKVEGVALSWGYNEDALNSLKLKFEPALTESGTYTIKFPERAVTDFYDSSISSPEFELTYTIKAAVSEPTGAPIAVTPEVGTTVESLSEVELTFDPNYYTSGVIFPDTQTIPSVYSASGEKLEVAVIMTNDLNKLTLKLNPALTESGTYTIKFPEGAVRDFMMYPIASPAFELTYTVEAPVVGGLPVAYEPEVGSEVPYLAKVTLYFSESDYPGGIDVTYFGTPEVYKDGQLIETSAYYAYDQYDYYKGYIEFTSPLTEAGTYTIKVKAGHFYEYLNESNAVPAFEMTYVVTGGGYVNNNPGPIAVIPASGSEVKEIDMISINFAEEDYPNGMDANSSTAVPVLNAAGEEVGKLKLQYDPDNYFAVKCTVLGGEPITAPGEYTIVIPEGHIWEYNGNKLETAVPEIVLTYTIKGEGVEEEVRLSSTVPAEGELDMSLYAGVFQGISLYFSEVVSMIADDQLPADMITIAKDGVVVEEKSLTKLVNDPFGDGNKVDLVFEKYSKAGEYVITIPGGWATYADGTVVGDIVLTYIIPENTDTNDFITDPEAGVVESLSKVWFQLTNRTYAAKNSYTAVPGYQWYGKPYVIDDATGEKVTDCYFYKEEDHCAFGIDLNTPIVTSGSYTLVIPQGQIAYVQKQKDLTEDEVNPEFRIQYTIEGEDPQYFPVTVNPEEGVVESLSVVTVTFAEGVTLELDENSSSYPRFYEVTENGDEFVRNGDFSVSGNVFTFSVYTDEETDELDAITEAGEYAFIIPVGLIKVDGVFTTEYRFEYQIGGATAALTITDPVPGTTVERLSQFTVVAPGATTLEQNETRRTIQLVKNDELVSNVTVLSTEGNTAVLQLSNVVTESGDYTLIIPPYFFLADGVEIEEQHTFNYTVLNDAPVFKKPTINPEEGLVEEFTEFVLTWEDVTEIVLDNSVMMGTSGIAMYDAMNEKVSDFIGMPSGDNAVMLNFMGAAPAEPGEYRLVIPAGMFTVDGATNHEMEFFYMYIPAIDFEITIDKSGTVESVEEFVLSFNPCEESVEINSECEESIGLWTSTYPEELIGYFEVTIEGLTAKLELTVDPITVEDGDYTILVPQDYFFVDGMPCGGETFNVTLVKSGIYGIEADAQGLNVYSVSGILVLRDAKATELKNLQKGIYIVNGKKVLVR